MSLADALKQVVLIQRTIPGIVTAHDNPPEGLTKEPCFVTYADEMAVGWPRTSMVRTKTYNIIMDLYLSRAGNLPTSVAYAMPFIDLVSDTFDQNVTLGGTAVSSGIVTAKAGHMSYADVPYFGVKFTLKAMIKEGVVYKG